MPTQTASGSGINVNTRPGEFPAELRETATSLYAAGGREIDRVGFAETLLPELENQLDRADAGDPELVARGRIVYQESCAACHGSRLEGQPNWRERGEDGMLPAPPHDMTGHTWHHSDALLFDVTKYGSTYVIGSDYKSNMPGFAESMTDGDIWAVLAYIKSTWPLDIQEIQSELEDTRQQ